MNIAGYGSGSIGQRHISADSDPYLNVSDPFQNVTDPQHRRKRNPKLRSASDTNRQNVKMTPEKRKNKNRNFMFRRAAGGLEVSSGALSPSQSY